MDKVEDQIPPSENPPAQPQQPPIQPATNPPCCSKTFLIVVLGFLVIVFGASGYFLTTRKA